MWPIYIQLSSQESYLGWYQEEEKEIGKSIQHGLLFVYYSRGRCCVHKRIQTPVDTSLYTRLLLVLSIHIQWNVACISRYDAGVGPFYVRRNCVSKIAAHIALCHPQTDAVYKTCNRLRRRRRIHFNISMFSISATQILFGTFFGYVSPLPPAV